MVQYLSAILWLHRVNDSGYAMSKQTKISPLVMVGKMQIEKLA